MAVSKLLEVSPNVHLLRGFTNVVIIAEETLTVIDTGFRGNEKRILKAVGKLGRSASEIENILINHHHADHVGSAARLRHLSGGEVFAHKDEVPYITGELPPIPLRQHPRVLTKTIWPLVARTRFIRAEATEVNALEDGQVLPPLGGLRAIHIPGHTPGTVCFYSPQRRLVIGGCVVWNWLGRLSMPLFRWDADKAIESLRKVAQLDFEILIPAHGPPLLHDAAQTVREFVDRIQVDRTK